MKGIVGSGRLHCNGWLDFNIDGFHTGESRKGKGRHCRVHEDAECIIINKEYLFKSATPSMFYL